LRGHTLKVGKQLRDAAAVKPAPLRRRSPSPWTRRSSVAATTANGIWRFASVAKTETDIAALIRRNLETVGRAAETELTAFTDGCPGLRSVLVKAGCEKAPIADWFHIAMRLQHAKQAASGLSTDTPGRMQANAAIVAEVERLHWRIWNGKARTHGSHSSGSARSCMSSRASVHRTMGVPSSRKTWHAWREVDNYLRGQSARLVNYAERYGAGLRVGTSVTEGTANFLVNRRMNEAQQMRWSRSGADLPLQVRCEVYNSALGPGLGHRFEPIPSAIPELAMAAWSSR
jgi:hypothetical protein